MTRAAQREQTRRRIVGAAIDVFSTQGFEASSTRTIAERAGITQGLLTYHFPTKDLLWRAAAQRLFDLVEGEVVGPMVALGPGSDVETGREYIRIYARFVAQHPELFQFMVDAQTDPAGRCAWLVDTHLRPLYRDFETNMARFKPELLSADIPHVFYSMVGAASLLFGLGEEARQLCDLDTRRLETVEAHADHVARLLLPS
ncbi:MAG: TetR/AcrR family transcriptional regulator [Acidimicrobiales bacterium]